MANSLEIKVDDRDVRRLFEAVPKIANQEMNRAHERSGSEFLRSYAPHFRSVVKVASKAKVGKKARGHPAVPVDMKRMGVKARVFGRSKLQGKGMFIRTRNPLLVAREKGDVANAPPGGWLYIHGTITGRGKKKRLAAQSERVARLRQQHGGRFIGGRKYISDRPIVARVKQIRIPANLRLVSSWTAFHPRAIKIHEHAISEMVRRMNLRNERTMAA